MVRFNTDITFIGASGIIRAAGGDIIIGSGGSLRPETDCRDFNPIDLGRDSSRWNTLFACSGNFLTRPTVNGSGVLLQGETTSFNESFNAVQEATTDQSTNSTSFVNAVTLAISPEVNGLYRLGWSVEAQADKNKGIGGFRTQIEGIKTLMNITPSFDKKDNNDIFAGFAYCNLGAGSGVDVTLDFLSEKNDTSITVANAHLEAWRVGDIQ